MTVSGSPPPTPVDWRNLIQAGRDLLNPQPAGHIATDEHIRRAISNAYYALFHALAENNASTLISSPSNALNASAWSRVYRGLDHGTAHRELQRHRHELSVPARSFADTFSKIQHFRYLADYDHNAAFTTDEAIAQLAQAETSILDYSQVSPSERLYIATLTLIRSR